MLFQAMLLTRQGSFRPSYMAFYLHLTILHYIKQHGMLLHSDPVIQ